eukprot:1146130-Pelagomonas_calceolata.AAC.4
MEFARCAELYVLMSDFEVCMHIDDDSQAATIRTNAPAPPDCPLYYFEVTSIMGTPWLTEPVFAPQSSPFYSLLPEGAPAPCQKGYIGIGFQTEDVLLSRLPGWDPHSYGVLEHSLMQTLRTL